MNVPASGPIGHRIEHLETVDSTNTYLRQKAALGAPHGLVIIADEQTAGRGRFGRQFQSPSGKGLYLSVLLRPRLSASQLATLTPWAAVAVCRTIEALTGLRPEIKWINDILLGGKKLCGILTEAQFAPDGTPDYVILGIGLNLSQTDADFSPEVASIATSLGQHLSCPPSREQVSAALVAELERMWAAFPEAQAGYLAAYRARCASIGKAVNVITPAGSRPGFAQDLGQDFSLQVRFSDGTVEHLHSGEVSIRESDQTSSPVFPRLTNG